MKAVLFVSVVLFISVTVSSYSNRKFLNFEKCAKENNVSEDALKLAFDMISIEGIKEHKCFMKCIFQIYNTLNDDNTVDREKFKNAFKTDWQNPQDQEKIIPVAVNCLGEEKVIPDICDYTHAWMECFIKGIQEVRAETTFTRYDSRK